MFEKKQTFFEKLKINFRFGIDKPPNWCYNIYVIYDILYITNISYLTFLHNRQYLREQRDKMEENS